MFDGDGNFQREIKINVPFDENAKPAIGNKPDLTNYLQTGGSFAPGAPWAICCWLSPRNFAVAIAAPNGPTALVGWKPRWRRSGAQARASEMLVS